MKSVLTDKQAVVLQAIIEIEPAYGFQLLRYKGRKLNEGSLYAILHKLEDQRFVVSEIEKNKPKNRGVKRRFYKSTELGRKILKEWSERTEYSSATADEKEKIALKRGILSTFTERESVAFVKHLNKALRGENIGPFVVSRPFDVQQPITLRIGTVSSLEKTNVVEFLITGHSGESQQAFAPECGTNCTACEDDTE